MAVPQVALLPDPPLPTDAEDVFDAKAGASLTAQQAMVPQINFTATWIGQQVTTIQDYATAASASADAAAQSAAIALAAQTDMSDQVAQAATYANNAAASAAAAESAPGSIGNLAAIYAAIEARG